MLSPSYHSLFQVLLGGLRHDFLLGHLSSSHSPISSDFPQKTSGNSNTDSPPVGNHCQSGMVAAINAPATGNTLAAFALLAKNATTVNFSGGAVGGILKSGGGRVIGGSNSTTPVTTGGSTSLSTSSYTTTYATSSVVSTIITSSYTSNGVVYTTTYPSAYTTAYTTAAPTASVVTSVSGGAAAGTGSSAGGAATNTPQSGAAGVVASLFAVGAGLFAALVIV